MISARIIGTKLMPYLRPLTQNKLMTPKEASTITKRYMETGNIEDMIAPIEQMQVPEEIVAVKAYVINKIKEEETKWKNA